SDLDSGASLVLVDPAQADTLAEVQSQLAGLPSLALLPAAGGAADGTILEAAVDDTPVEKIDSPARGDDLAQLLYTSGTTSAPKGAMMSHSALVHVYVSCVLGLDFTADDEPLVSMPLYYSAVIHVFAYLYL